ncbi:conserved repeat domain protein [Rhodococcus wratislaviensis]|uniref:Conserved repeat domain protein n=1 Tax=Rhodococcus wratislaviensis TaxID=44752 RepID=A0A402C7J1_RHOWR|nr:conserved repeat domain protein [Rhodococcus wratislaviensis]
MSNSQNRVRRRVAACVFTVAVAVGTSACDPSILGPFGSGSSSGSLGSAGPTNEPGPAEGFAPIDPDAPSDWAPAALVTTEIVPKPQTVVAAAGTVLSISGDPNASQVVVLAPGQAIPAVGGFLAVDVDQDAPDGALGRVQSTGQNPSGSSAVTITPARIDEAYEVFRVNETVTLDDAVRYDAGATDPNSRSGPSVGAKIKKNANVGMFECKSTAGLEFTVDFDFNTITTNIVFDAFAQYLRVTTEIAPQISAALKAAGATECTSRNSSMPSAWLPVAGPVGILFRPKVELKFDAELEVSAGLGVTGKRGIEISGARARAVSGVTPWTKELRTTLSGGASAFVGLEAPISLGGRASAGFSAGPRASFEASADGCVEAFGGVRINGFVEVDLFIANWRAQLDGIVVGTTSLTRACEDDPAPTTQPTTTPPPTTIPTEPDIVPGSLTGLQIDAMLRCRVDSPRDGRSVFYGNNSCGTHAAVNGVVFGGLVGSPWTPVSGPADSGAGTAADPRVVRTSVAAGESGVSLDQVDTFVENASSYATTITVRNTGSSAARVVLYRAADCYLSQSDFGIGELFPGAVSCTSPDGRRISWTDLSGGSARKEAFYATIWSDIEAGVAFDDTALADYHDNGAGLSWEIDVPAGGTAQIRSRFSLDEPLAAGTAQRQGRVPPAPTGTPDPPKPGAPVQR